MTHREMAVVDEEELQGVVRSIREGAKERWRASFVCVRARSDLLKAAPVALHFFALRTLALGEHHAACSSRFRFSFFFLRVTSRSRTSSRYVPLRRSLRRRLCLDPSPPLSRPVAAPP